VELESAELVCEGKASGRCLLARASALNHGNQMQVYLPASRRRSGIERGGEVDGELRSGCGLFIALSVSLSGELRLTQSGTKSGPKSREKIPTWVDLLSLLIM
jgi:hypothetical protein